MKQIPSIFRYNYVESANYIIRLFAPLNTKYNEEIIQFAQNPAKDKIIQIRVIEEQLAWLINIVANIITGQSFVEIRLSSGQEKVDADLSKKIFDLLENIDYRLVHSV